MSVFSPRLGGLLVVVSLLAALAIPPATHAAAPPNDLIRLVPDDVGFCLVVQDLRGHAATLLRSAFYKKWQQSPLGQGLGAVPGLEPLADLDKLLPNLLGISWEQFRDDILGDAFVFAYRPAPPKEPAKEQGLLLVRARDPKLLADVVARFNKIQKDSGDLKELEDREHNGRKYVHRIERNGDNYYYLHGPLLVFATKEKMLQEALDREALAADAETTVGRQLRLLGADKQLASLWINPRAFDADMERNATAATGGQAILLRAFSRYWKALEGIALFLDWDRDFQVELAVRARMEALPESARRFFAEAARPSELWSCFPEHALLAVAGRIDVPALADMLGEFLTPEQNKELRTNLESKLGAVLGKDITREVLPCLGPDIGLCITAPPADEKSWFPHIVVALRVKPGENKTAPVDQAVLSAVDLLVQLAVLGYNGQHTDQMVLKSEMQDTIKVRYLVNDAVFPAGLQPAYGLVRGYLLLASSPAVFRDFGATLAGAAVSKDTAEVPVLRASVKHLCQFLRERREAVVAYVAQQNDLKKEDVERKLDTLLACLQLFDRVEVSQRAQAGQVNLILRVRLTDPLK